MQCLSCHAAVQGEPPFCPTCGAPLPREAAPDPLIGRTLAGKYRMVQLLGEGGMGAVYIGEQSLGTKIRKVAIKTLHAHLSRDEAVRARFQRECEVLAGLQHPNTVQVFDFGTSEDGLLYIVMEFVQGQSIAATLEREGALRAERASRILQQIGGSLAEAHLQGVIHRDLKPDNVVLTERAGQKDFVKVLDFGIAKRSGEADRNEKKLTQQGMVLGTPPYMSPEQFTGQALDARSDIYSLAVMAYEMLTGKLPFDAANAWEWATMHMTAAPTPIEAAPNGALLPESMRAAVMRALAKNADQRFATVTEFVERFMGRTGPDEAEVSQRKPTAGFKPGPSMQPPAGPAATNVEVPSFQAGHAGYAGQGGASAPVRTAGMDAPPAMGGFDAPAASAYAPGSAEAARPKTQIGEPIMLPPGAFAGTPGGPPAYGGAPAYGAPSPGPGTYAAPPVPGSYGVPAGPVHGARGAHGANEGRGGNKALILGVAGVVAVLSLVAIAWGAGAFGSGGSKPVVPPLDLSSSSGAPTAPVTATTPPPAETPPAPALGNGAAVPLAPGPHVPTTPPPKTNPTTPPKTAPTPAPTPTPTPAPPPAPTPAPTPAPPPQPPPPPRPTPQPPAPAPAPPPPTRAEPPECAQARAMRAGGGGGNMLASLERKCRIGGGTP
jgi:serine/threonine-protein kinase